MWRGESYMKQVEMKEVDFFWSGGEIKFLSFAS
jgi:hypothetical protein